MLIPEESRWCVAAPPEESSLTWVLPVSISATCLNREFSSVLGPQPFWRTPRCSRTRRGEVSLDDAFALIEAHPAWMKNHPARFLADRASVGPGGSGCGLSATLSRTRPES